MVRFLSALSLLLMTASCVEWDQKQSTLIGQKVPGLGDMYAPAKEDVKEDKWWHEYYGSKTTEESWTW